MVMILVILLILVTVPVYAQIEPPFTLSNAPEPLAIPTYDGSGQVVHPSIVYFETGYPYKYVMVFTPYPNSNDDYENPSVIFSNDGLDWTSDGVKNPLDYPHDFTNYHLCDPDILWDGKEFKLYYLEAYHGTSPYTYTLKLFVSKDGVHWNGPYVLLECQGMVSPSVIYDNEEGKYKMWFVDHSTSPFTVWYAESLDGYNWTNFTQVNFSYSRTDINPWHPEVQKLSNGMYMMLVAFSSTGSTGRDTRVYLAVSWDGFNWTVYDASPILDVGPSGSWDDGKIYRVTFIVYNSTLHVWYSAQSSNGEWHVGYTSRDISDFLGGYEIYSDNVIWEGPFKFQPDGSIPVTVIEESGNDLIDYVVKIELNSTNFDDWAKLPNETYIYVTDADNNPLYYWVEYVNPAEKKAIIWVKLNLTAYETKVIYLHYGEETPYPEYNNPYKVFLFFDDFNTNSSINYTIISGTWSWETNYSRLHGTGSKAVELLLNSSIFFGFNYTVRARVKVEAGTAVRNGGLIVRAQDSSNFFLYKVNNETHIGVYKKSGGTYSGLLASLDIDTTPTDWHIQEVKVVGMKSWYCVDSHCLTYNSVDIENGTIGFQTYDAHIYVDWVAVRKAVEIEPRIIIGWTPGYKGEYYVPITVIERSGNDLVDYAVKIELNSTNFAYWGHIRYENGSDIYFTDAKGNPLYYWIEYISIEKRHLIAWVKIPKIPANGTFILQMHYGGDNPYEAFRNPEEVFIFFDDFNILNTSKWNVEQGSASVSNSILEATGQFTLTSTVDFTLPVFACAKVRYHGDDGIGWGFRDVIATEAPNYEILLYNGQGEFRLAIAIGGTLNTYTISSAETTQFHIDAFIWKDNEVKVFRDYEEVYTYSGSVPTGSYPLRIVGWKSNTISVDWIYVTKYVDPEPSIEIGKEKELFEVKLPIKSIVFTHNITYSPKASDFTHSFSTSNETTAGYELSDWSWRVYANPYQNGGSSYENVAYLVSEINITLPYGEAFIKNITLQAKANGTGTLRQLWVKVLNSSGEVITEITNASIGTSWTEIVIPIEQEVADLVTIWINATVKSSTTTGEEIDIANVRVFTENVFNPVVTCPIVANEKYFNCSFIHTFDLGNSSLVNETFSKIYITNYLTYNTTDYPVKPSYVGNVTINNNVYNVYVINPSNYTGSYIFYVLLENRYRSGTWKVHTHGVTLSEMIIGDVVCIDLPETGNITIRLGEWNHTWLNTSHVCWRINNTGTLTIEFVRNLTNVYDVGYGSYVITVTYGNLTINTLDINNTLINYEELKMVMYNRDWGLKYEGKGFGKFFRNDLWAGNYTVTIYYLDVPICNFTYWLNSTNTGSIIDITCNMFKQGKDYRGINKTVAWMWNVTLLNVTNLNKKYPWSITKFVLNGSSGAKFCIAWDYESDLPTAVNIEGNASELTWKWVNTTLIICGRFGSTIYVTVTDLYKLSIKYFDRLGRLLKYLDKLPETIINNEIVLKGYDVWIYLPPEDYVVKVPKEIVKNFVFPLHNVNGSTVNTISFSIVHSDVLIKPVYKVPVEFTELKIVYVTPSEVYVQGRLVDYLGYPVVNKSIYVELWSLVKNYRLDGDLVKTDEAGYFITKPFTIPVNESVMFRIWFEGDDIYNGNETSIEIMQVSTYTVKPSIWQKPEIIIIALIILAVIIILIAVLKRGKVVALSSRKKMFKIT